MFLQEGIKFTSCLNIDLKIPIHHFIILVSVGCLHVPAAGEVPSKSGAFDNPKSTGVKPNDDFVGNEIV